MEQMSILIQIHGRMLLIQQTPQVQDHELPCVSGTHKLNTVRTCIYPQAKSIH